MDWKTYFYSWIPGTISNNAYKKKLAIDKGLDFAKKMSHTEFDTVPLNQRLDIYRTRQEYYLDFEQAIRLCRRGKCYHTCRDLQNFADNVSPGLGNVDVIVAACKATKEKK
jgi:hypothetical protein